MQTMSTCDPAIPLAALPIGAKTTIIGITPNSRGSKKFADAGIVPGNELFIEAHAPFGGLIRIKILETSMALNRVDAKYIIVRNPEVCHA